MISSGMLLFIFATSIPLSTASTSEVKYEGPSKITVAEHIEDKPAAAETLLPVQSIQGSPPFIISNFVYQGSNFFFNPQISLPSIFIPPTIKAIVDILKPAEDEKNDLVEPILLLPAPLPNVIIEPVQLPIIVQEPGIGEIHEIPPAPKLPPFTPHELQIPVLIEEPLLRCGPSVPVIIEPVELPQIPVLIDKLSPPLNPLAISIPEGPELPPLMLPEVPIPNPPAKVVVEELTLFIGEPVPCEQIVEVYEVPSSPEITVTIFPPLVLPEVPILIEEPVKIPGGSLISEINYEINEIPTPPELPPLVLPEIPKLIVDDKIKTIVVLIPTPPELPPMLPPPLVITKKIMKTQIALPLPTICAQNIIIERVLPNIIYEKTKTVELISFPASQKLPVFTSFSKK